MNKINVVMVGLLSVSGFYGAGSRAVMKPGPTSEAELAQRYNATKADLEAQGKAIVEKYESENETEKLSLQKKAQDVKQQLKVLNTSTPKTYGGFPLISSAVKLTGRESKAMGQVKRELIQGNSDLRAAAKKYLTASKDQKKSADNELSNSLSDFNQKVLTKKALENNLTKFGTFKTDAGTTTLAMKDLPMLNDYKLEARQTFIKQLSPKQEAQILQNEGLQNLKSDIIRKQTEREGEQVTKPSLWQRAKQSLSSLVGKGRSAKSNARTTQKEKTDSDYVNLDKDFDTDFGSVRKPTDYDGASRMHQVQFNVMTRDAIKNKKPFPTSVAEAVAMFEKARALEEMS